MTLVEWLGKGDGNKKYKVKVNHKTVQFGNKNYQHFRDSTPLKYYKHLDHNDPKRREAYRARHGAQGYHLKKYSPAWFSWHYLW